MEKAAGEVPVTEQGDCVRMVQRAVVYVRLKPNVPQVQVGEVGK